MLVLWLLLLLSIGVLLCIIGLVIFGVAGFCTLVGKFFVLVEQITGEWSQACQRAAVSFLPQPPTPGEQYSFQEQMDILFSRLIYLALVSLFIAGEVYNMLLALPALSHQPPSLPPLPGLFDLAASALFIIPPALFGMVLLEAAGFVPFREGLFPTGLSLWRRVALSLYATVSLVISVVVISASWQFRAVYLDPVARQAIDPTALSAMAEYVLRGLGLLAALSSLLIIQAFRIGWGCVIAVYLYIVSLGWLFVSSLTQLIARCCEWISLYFSHNSLSPYDLPPDPIKQTRGVGRARGNRLIEPSQEETVIAYPLLPPGGKETMKTEKVGSIVFAGQLGSDLYDSVVNEVRVQRGADVLCTSGGFARSARRERFVLPATESISPKEADIQQALGTDASDAHVYTKLLNRMAEYLKKTHGEKGLRAEPATLLFVLDRSVLMYAEDMLRNIKNALRDSSLLVLTAFSLEDLRDANVQAGKEVLEVLWQDGVLATTLVVDPLHAPFREAEDKQTLYRFLTRAVVSLLIANKQYHPNLSSVEALTQLHASSPFMTVSFASAPVSPGTLPGRYGWRRLLPGGNTPRGAGDLMLTINTTTELITQVLDPAHPKHSETRAFNAAVSQQGSAFVVCNIPLTQQEEEKLEQAKQRLDWYVDTKYPFATALLSRANGVPYANQLPSSYLAQANCFYAIHPGIFSLAPTVEAGKRTVLLPQATPGTVGTPAEEAKEAEASSQSLVPVVEEQSAGANGAKPATNGSQAVKPATRRGRPKKDSSR